MGFSLGSIGGLLGGGGGGSGGGSNGVFGMLDPILGSSFWNSTPKGGGYSEIPLAEDQKQAVELLKNLMNQTNLPKQQVAGLTDMEKTAGNQISSLLTNGIPGMTDAFNAAKEEMNKSTDIMSLPEVQGLFKSINEAGSLESNRLGRTLQLKGSASSSKGRDVLGRNVTDTQQKLASSIAPFLEAERSRKYNAINLLANLGERATTQPLSLAMQFGGTARDVANQGYAADYNQQMFPYNTQASIASNLLGQQRYSYQEPIVSPSMAMQLAMLGNAAATVGAAF